MVERPYSKPGILVRSFADGNGVAVEIGGTGSGIAPAIRDRIFDPFFTEPAAGTPRAAPHVLSWRVATMTASCTHLGQIRDVKPRTPDGCEECLATNGWWVHLRLCLECGHVGCCDQSPNKHATKHFHATRHPIMKSFEPGEEWGWCYVDELELTPEEYER